MRFDKKIAVVGAGPMGLAVAFQLMKLGYKPVIFEAGERIGGMATCFPFAGEEIERFYHFHCTSDHEFLQLLSELGIRDKFHWVKTKMGYYYGGTIQPWGNPIAILKFRGLSFGAKIRYSLHAFISSKRKDYGNLDNKEATSWLRSWVGYEAYEKLWKNLFEFKFYHEQHSLSAAWISARIRRIAQSRYNLFNEKLGYLEGGTQTYLNELEQVLIKNGIQIRLNEKVEHINIDDKKVFGLTTKNGFEQFEKVCCTIPTPFIPEIAKDLTPYELYQYQNIKNIAVICVIVACKKKVSENFWLNINDQRMKIPGLVEYSNLRPCKTNIVYVPFYMPSEHPDYKLDDKHFEEKVKEYINNINPNIIETDFLNIKVSRYKHSQPICGINFKQKLPDVQTSVTGLWIADTCYYYPEDRGISESTKFGIYLANKITD
jgi:protoporphyrinogen oxidase